MNSLDRLINNQDLYAFAINNTKALISYLSALKIVSDLNRDIVSGKISIAQIESKLDNLFTANFQKGVHFPYDRELSAIIIAAYDNTKPESIDFVQFIGALNVVEITEAILVAKTLLELN